MGSEDMVRLVIISETRLFPLDTLVRDGIIVGHHWPALYFLSGLTKLTSVPPKLLNFCLKAGDDLVKAGDFINLLSVNLLVDMSMSSLITGNNCNPYFFQMLFETQSPDLNSSIFREVNVTTTITSPLECFVTAWCVANSDPTSKWKCTFGNVLILKSFIEWIALHNTGSKKLSCCSSVVGLHLHCTQPLIHFLSLPSVFPCLKFLGFVVTPAGIAEMMTLLHGVEKLSTLKCLLLKLYQVLSYRVNRHYISHHSETFI